MKMTACEIVPRHVGQLLHLKVQVMLSCRNSTHRPELRDYVLHTVKGFDTCGSQHPRLRIPEKLLQSLTPSKEQVTDQTFSPSLLCELTAYLPASASRLFYDDASCKPP